MASDSRQLQPDWLNAQCPREGRYVLGPLLGRGGMGQVHEAWDVVLCRTVALKILKDIEPTALIRFMHEAQIHARVVHPNICRVYDVDNHEGSLRVAMQLVLGPNLEQAWRELSPGEAAAVMALVAQAVHVVHHMKLVHRDLKPSNILLEQGADGQWTPYVCDFGLAMALDEPALTFTHGVIGTPAYMAPEQLRGERDRISPATDVYALGGTLHFALTGRPPAGGRQGPVLDPRLPRDLRVIIARCLEEDPELRYPSAAALAEDLWRWRGGDPIHASSPNALARLGHRARRGLRPLAPALLALGAAAMLGAAWQARLDHQAALDRQQMEAAQRLALEAEQQTRDFRLELTMPIHDLRPAYAGIRARMARDRARMLALAPRFRGQGHFALGSAHYLLHEYAAAQAELQEAWALGFHDPEVARLLAWDAVPVADAAEQAAEFDPPAGLPPPAPGQDPPALLRALGREPGQGEDAQLAYLDRNYVRSASLSCATFLASPWHWEAAGLEAASLTALARQERDAGRLAEAAGRYRDAVAAAKAGLAGGRSDPALYHAWFQAARGLAELSLEQGRPPQPRLADLQDQCAKALRLDPGDPGLQDDWLVFSCLRARQAVLSGQDPEPLLKSARAFLGAWPREPLTVALRADRMLVYWLTAEREFRIGGDPGPALTEAMKGAGHTPFLCRDIFWEVVNLKARVDAARGTDPRPAMDALLARFQAPGPDTPWSVKESLAAGWLIRAEWEKAHGLDPGPSLRSARALAGSARSQNPDSASAIALEGLGQVLELQAHPRERARLLGLARENLRQALARCPQGSYQDQLRRALLEISG